MSDTMLQTALDMLGSVPALDRIPTMDMMTDRTRQIAERYPDLIEVQTVGHSSGGEPIEMVSIGSGPRSALLIGAPHPNEPIGCMTIEHLLQRLCESGSLREALPFRWHCIKAIEPDALRLNEGWFDQPGDLHHYLANFFRPALIDQAEYGFPFDPTLELPVATTPENDAWRAAYALTRPDLLYSLHNADYGGAFYILSPPTPALVAALPQQPARFGVGLNDVGEPLSDTPSITAGVFEPFDTLALATGGSGAWPAGDSSAGYAVRHGAQALIAEVSIWESSNAADRSASPFSRSELERLRRSWSADILRLGRTVLDQVSPIVDVAHGLILRTVEETLARAESQAAVNETPDHAGKLSCHEYEMHWVGLRLIMLRKIALIRRLALLAGDAGAPVAAACKAYMDAGLVELQQRATLKAMPLRDLVATQLCAGFTAAAHLANQVH